MTKRVGLYLRVSTGDQTIENQRQVLQSVCQARGWTIAQEFIDHGISGAKGRDKRPGYDAMLKAVTRGKIDLVASWSVDRLGRSLTDLVAFLSEIQGAGCELYLDRQAVDTTTPSGRALFQMMGVFAEFERAMITDRIHAGIARARTSGTKSGKPIGRASISLEKISAVRAELAKGTGIVKTAKLAGCGVSAVQRIKKGK